jgi:DNA-binding YbaB/EbfC family protein
MQPGIPPVSPGNPGDIEAFRKQAEQLRGQVMPDLQAALAQAQQVQQQLLEAQQKIADTEVTGQAGGGLVEISLNGHGKVTAVRIDPGVVDPADVETLQDLIVGAFEDAAREMADTVKNLLGPLAQMRQQQGPAGT